MLAFLAFMALRLKLLQSAEFLCRNGPHEAKKLQNFNKCSCGLVCGLWKKNLAFFIFLEVLDTYEVQWYTKIMYVSSISPLPKTKPKFPFRYIVGYWKHPFGIPGVRPMFLKPKLHKESKNGFKTISCCPYRKVIFFQITFLGTKNHRKNPTFSLLINSLVILTP